MTITIKVEEESWRVKGSDEDTNAIESLNIMSAKQHYIYELKKASKGK